MKEEASGHRLTACLLFHCLSAKSWVWVIVWDKATGNALGCPVVVANGQSRLKDGSGQQT